MSQLALHAACVHCGEAIPPGANRYEDPLAHITCGWQATKTPQLGDDDEVTRQIRNWVTALDMRTAVTGTRWEQAARTAEEPERVVWDRQRRDGSLHLPWVEIHAVPCPGEPWRTEPDRWNGSAYCGLKHWHSRADLGLGDTR